MNDQPRIDAIDKATKGLQWPEAYRLLEKEAGKIERELAAMTIERDKDYAGMREMQAKFIAADQELRAMTARAEKAERKLAELQEMQESILVDRTKNK